MNPSVETIKCSAELLELTARQCVVRYQVTNTGTVAVWLFNQLFDVMSSGKYRLNPAKVYLRLAPDGCLVLAKRLVPVPDEVMVEFPEVPCVSRLEPGASAGETLTVAFPTRAVWPYTFGLKPEIRAEAVNRVQFELGYLADHSAIRFYQAADALGLPFRYPAYQYAIGQQRTCAAVLLPAGRQ